MKKEISQFLMSAGILAATATLAHAGGGGAREGGHTVRRNDQERLLDYVGRGSCIERTEGSDLISRTPRLAQMLESLKQVDWYFGRLLEEEIKGLRVCFSNDLTFVSAQDPAGVFRPEPEQNLQQGAVRIRLSNQVFANQRAVNALPPTDQAGLWIHEALHSFIGYEDGRHYEHVRSFNRIIRDLSTRPTSRQSLYHAMEDEAVDFPRSTDMLDRYRHAFEFVWLTLEQQEQAVLNAQEPELLVIDDATYASLVPYLYQELAISPKNALISAMQRIFVNRDESAMEALLTRKTFGSLSAGDVALSVADRLSPAKRRKLFELIGNGRRVTLSIIDNIDQRFAQASATIEQHRICANSDLIALAGQSPQASGCVPVMTLRPNPDSSTVAQVELAAASQWVRELIAQGEWQTVESLIAPSGRMRRAFSLTPLLQAIMQLPDNGEVSMQREKNYALERVDTLSHQLWENWVRQTSRSLLPADARRLKQLTGIQN